MENGSVFYWDELARQKNEKVQAELAKCLHDRYESAAKRLFGPIDPVGYTVNPDNVTLEMARKLNTLSFGDDVHPDCYSDDDIAAYYCLRYEMGYAFEYYYVYKLMLEDWWEYFEAGVDNCPEFDVLSVGSGQGLDLWGLMYARQKTCERWFPDIEWTGVDLEEWKKMVEPSHYARFIDKTNICYYLKQFLGNRLPRVMMFPKVITELPMDVIDNIAEWIGSAKTTHAVHYLCIVHTDCNSLAKPDSISWSKAAKLRDAFESHKFFPGSAEEVPCYNFFDWSLPTVVSDRVHDYKVLCSKGRGTRHTVGGKDFGYDCYLAFNKNNEQVKDVIGNHETTKRFGDFEPSDKAFSPFGWNGKYKHVRDAVSSLEKKYGNELENNELRSPRERLHNMAFQIHRLCDDGVEIALSDIKKEKADQELTYEEYLEEEQAIEQMLQADYEEYLEAKSIWKKSRL